MAHQHTATVIDRALANNVRIEDAHVSASNTLREVAIDFVRTYRGHNSFVQNIAVYLADRGTLSIAQMRGALNVMIAEARAASEADARRERDRPVAEYIAAHLAADAVAGVKAGAVFIDLRSAGDRAYDDAFGDGAAEHRARNEAAKAGTSNGTIAHTPVIVNGIDLRQPIKPVVPDGYYTVIINAAGDYRTLKVSTADTDRFDRVAPGTQIVSVLSGGNNESDYTGFAFLAGDRYTMWRRHANARDLGYAIALLVKGFEAAAAEYVKRSGACFVCGRTLTTPASLAAGIGPICAERIGAAYGDFDFAALAKAAQAARDGIDAERAKAQADIDELFPSK